MTTPSLSLRSRLTLPLLAALVVAIGALSLTRGATAQGTPSQVVFSSATRLASVGVYTSGALTPPPGVSGVMIQLNLTSCTSGCSVVETLIQLDPLTSTTDAYPSAMATLSANGATDWLMYPGITAVSNRRVNDKLVTYPNAGVTYKVRATIAGANAKFDSSATWIR